MPLFASALAAALACSPLVPPRVIIDEMGQAICHTPPPPGTGLPAGGRGVLLAPMSGVYTLIGLEALRYSTVEKAVVGERVRFLQSGAFQAVQATSSKLEWIRPDGVREAIPSALLYPPFEGPKY